MVVVVREVEVELNQSRVISAGEIKRLVDCYSFGCFWRLMFLLMACCGLRSCEVVNLRLENFKQECNILRYRIRKPIIKKRKDYLVKEFKVRSVKIPSFLREELVYYFRKNIHTFRDGFVFPSFLNGLGHVTTGGLRDELGKKRRELGGSFLDVLKRNVLGNTKGKLYRISTHSFRRFYNTVFHLTEADHDIVLTAKNIGHTKIDVNALYTFRPEDIGLEDLHKGVTFEQIFRGSLISKGQMLLEVFM